MTTPSDQPFRGVIALECAPGTRIGRDALGQADGARLAELLGRDLALLVPAVRSLDLALGAIHFDPAEVLRADWPLHRILDDLRMSAPQGREATRTQESRVIALGADALGLVPALFRADDALRGGPLRVLPFVLGGDAEVVAVVEQALEDNLLDLGMAKADTALHAQDAFGARIEHARYLTAFDLAAMTGMQYRNQGLDHVWQLLEAMLVLPDDEAWLDALPEPLVHYASREARMALFTPHAWRARYATDRPVADGSALERAYAHFEARQRQLASILQAHGVPVTFVHCDELVDARAALE